MSKHSKNTNKATKRYRRKLWVRNPHCWWCGCLTALSSDEDGQPNFATIDHLIPSSKGGSNAHDNLVLSCAGCNQERADSGLPPVAWREKLDQDVFGTKLGIIEKIAAIT